MNRLPDSRRLWSKTCLTTMHLVALESESRHSVSGRALSEGSGGPGWTRIIDLGLIRIESNENGEAVMWAWYDGLTESGFCQNRACLAARDGEPLTAARPAVYSFHIVSWPEAVLVYQCPRA